ncbi:uncharacterized protein CLUP02_00876 [Colletotrichum lupini]|uniref:Uncharacterized protein n=1 Tax=Colletotrichum lupini TaxID=145971 RepID=A0A9Q8W801_9PEZI|nr:uncharacterized protein CLUP02_00876 [Colletotrichum lupini]UQC74228.1 hypothetical protein CLUP02_00876 [Colletotrichum lupini]
MVASNVRTFNLLDPVFAVSHCELQKSRAVLFTVTRIWITDGLLPNVLQNAILHLSPTLSSTPPDRRMLLVSYVSIQLDGPYTHFLCPPFDSFTEFSKSSQVMPSSRSLPSKRPALPERLVAAEDENHEENVSLSGTHGYLVTSPGVRWHVAHPLVHPFPTIQIFFTVAPTPRPRHRASHKKNQDRVFALIQSKAQVTFSIVVAEPWGKIFQSSKTEASTSKRLLTTPYAARSQARIMSGMMYLSGASKPSKGPPRPKLPRIKTTHVREIFPVGSTASLRLRGLIPLLCHALPCAATPTGTSRAPVLANAIQFAELWARRLVSVVRNRRENWDYEIRFSQKRLHNGRELAPPSPIHLHSLA